ncbi:MAG: hypothetical protein BWY71_00197 [Planctomycetes bacterium ADurb.Bin412]|nr:MAG: hypothetical protein BWY71_00197 [Planctomycetes bacterium ADurb.Bin412]
MGNRLPVHQSGHRFIIDHLHLLNLMAGPESVEKVDKRHLRFQRRQMAYRSQIHDFLHRTGGHQRKARLPHRHHVAVIPENTQRMAGHRPGRHMKDRRYQFPGNLIHVRDHQQQTLAGGKRRGQCPSRQRTVYRSGRPGFRLHLPHPQYLAEYVFTSVCCPVIGNLAHRR